MSDIETGSELRVAEEKKKAEPTITSQRSVGGMLLGVLVFLGGLAILAFVFYIAYRLYGTPLSTLLNASDQTVTRLQRLLDVGVTVIIRILFLVLMTIIGSIITNRGIQMYASSRTHH